MTTTSENNTGETIPPVLESPSLADRVTRFAERVASLPPGIVEAETHHTPAPEDLIDTTGVVSAPYKEPVAESATGLRPIFSLESFVVGSGNRFAHAAALAVAEAPGEKWSPLLIYGPSGTGKTHLSHGVGNQIVENRPDAKVLYTTTEQMLNEFVDAIRTNSMNAFRKRYRTVDTLIVDDIQMLANKNRFQEEFLHILNDLTLSGRQVVLVADKPVKKGSDIREDLVGRIQGGLAVDAQHPDESTKVAIIESWQQASGTSTINPEVLEHVARSITNTRELHGAWLRLVALESMTGTVATTENVNDLLNLAPASPQHITHQAILAAIEEAYGRTVEELASPSKSKDLVHTRQLAMYAIRQLTGFSYPAIGDIFKRDHTTIMHGCDRVVEKMLEDDSFRHGVIGLLLDIDPSYKPPTDLFGQPAKDVRPKSSGPSSKPPRPQPAPKRVPEGQFPLPAEGTTPIYQAPSITARNTETTKPAPTTEPAKKYEKPSKPRDTEVLVAGTQITIKTTADGSFIHFNGSPIAAQTPTTAHLLSILIDEGGVMEATALREELEVGIGGESQMVSEGRLQRLIRGLNESFEGTQSGCSVIIDSESGLVKFINEASAA